jgi:6-phosphofructokinase 1
VLNASLAGVVEGCQEAAGIDALYGAEGGVGGILNESLIDLLAEDPDVWFQVARTPGSVLGSSRRKVDEGDYERMLAIFRKHNVRYVFANGGNGTMEMADQLGRAAENAGSDVRVIGIPKTIDNDLEGTDHTPGYPSAGRFFASAIRDIGADNRALPGVTFVEVLGRNAGWLAAAASLARERDDDAPHLIYFPERRLRFDDLASDVESTYRRIGRVVIAVCEGQLNERDEPFGADVRTSSRAPLALNLAHVLAQRISAELKISARSEKPGLLGRSCVELASPVDREEARMCGRAAVEAALAGETRKMITLVREPRPDYVCRTGLVAIQEVSGRERLFPTEWLPSAADGDLPQFHEWAMPLVGTISTRKELRRTRIV